MLVIMAEDKNPISPDGQEGARKNAHSAPAHNTHANSAHSSQNRLVLGIKKHGALSAFVIYLITSAVIFYPIAASFSGKIFGWSNNAYVNLWLEWWSGYSILHHAQLFRTNLIFWPLGSNLQAGFTPIALGVVASILSVLGKTAAYNLLFLFGFALSGAAMFVLAQYLIKDRRAALISGAIFAFSSAHISQAGSINSIMILWLPLFVYFTLRTINDGKSYLNLLGMALSFALATLTASIAQSQIALISLIGIIVYYIASKARRAKALNRRFAANLVLFAAMSFVFGSLVYVPLLLHGNLATDSTLAVTQSAISSFSISSYLNPLYHQLPIYTLGITYGLDKYVPFPPIEIAYIGYVSLALAIYGLYRQRGYAIWLGAAAFIALLLTLGPEVRIFGNYLPGIYSLYSHLPIIGVAYPGMFFMLSTLALGILSGIGIKEILNEFSKQDIGVLHITYIITCLIFAAIVFDFCIPFIASHNVSYTSTAVPKIYGILPKTANYSLLELPALPINSTNPYQYMAADTYYTSISHVPVIGGYVGIQNSSQYTLLYNLPLAVQAYNLQNTGAMSYSSPVYQNISNETLLTLYNYGASYIVLQKGAYNTSELDELGIYLIELFGAPIQNDNQTATFGTKSAIYNSIYSSYVAYPVIKYWNGTSAFVNGTAITEWHPSGAGAIIVYAPYQNQTAAASAYKINYINTTISIYASSPVAQNMTIDELSGNRTAIVGSIWLGKNLKLFKINAMLPSGPVGSTLLFLKKYTNEPISIAYVSFSRS